MFRLLKSVSLGRSVSTFVPQKVPGALKFPLSIPQKQIIATPTPTPTPLQSSLLEQYKNALIIPVNVAKELQNVHIGINDPSLESTEMILDSVLRKRRLKMKKHKLKKRRKAQRSLRRKLKKD